MKNAAYDFRAISKNDARLKRQFDDLQNELRVGSDGAKVACYLEFSGLDVLPDNFTTLVESFNKTHGLYMARKTILEALDIGYRCNSIIFRSYNFSSTFSTFCNFYFLMVSGLIIIITAAGLIEVLKQCSAQKKSLNIPSPTNLQSRVSLEA